MPMQTGSYDFKSSKKAHDDAEKKATNYVTDLSNGAFVHADGTPSDPTNVNAKGVRITDQIDIIRNGKAVAKLGSSATIGTEDGAHSVIDADGQRFYASDGTTQLANIGFGEGVTEIGGLSNAPFFTFGKRGKTATPYDNTCTYYLGDMCTYNNKVYVCKSEINQPEEWNSSHWQFVVGAYSIAEGEEVIASGYCSHAEGRHSKAVGEGSHAEGFSSAYGAGSHAEGGTYAPGFCSHSEGDVSGALGDCSHAGGYATAAIGEGSFAHGYENRANYNHQTVFGKYNDNQADSAFEIGNGYFDVEAEQIIRSNAFKVDWNGNVWAAGDIEDGNGNVLSDALFEDANGDLIVTRNISAAGKIDAANIPIFGTCSTAASTTTKVVTVSNSKYSPQPGGILSVRFTYDVPASAKLNVNSKGAKNIYYKNVAITKNIIRAGDTATFIYDGTNYHLISLDYGITDATVQKYVNLGMSL